MKMYKFPHCTGLVSAALKNPEMHCRSAAMCISGPVFVVGGNQFNDAKGISLFNMSLRLAISQAVWKTSLARFASRG